jgi:phage/plasmid-associated DNA primase
MDQDHLISGLDEVLGTGEPENEYVATIMNEYGPPAFLNDKGRISKLGEPFWAALRAHETHTIFSPEENAFYRYNDSNGLYGKITEGALRTDFAHRILTAAKRWKEWAGLERFRSSTQINGIIRHLEGQTEVIDAFRSRQDWQPVIACANCVVRIEEENGELVKEDFSPKFRLRHGCPYNYEPNAKCPNFEAAMLGHIEPDDKEVLQKLGGQALLGRNICQRIGILDGIGGSSKSEFVATLRGILGSHACAELRTGHLQERFEIGAIASASFLSGSDVPGDFLSRSGARVIKAMVGNDLLECEAKGSNFRVRIRGNFNILVTANTILHILLDGDHEAWHRRIIRIHFTKHYNGARIPEISRILLAEEGSGILNFFLQGAIKLLCDCRSHGDIQLSPRQQSLLHTMLAESDSLALYLQSAITRVPYAEGTGVATDEILQGYIDFCQQQHWNPQIASFSRHLPKLMAKFFGASPTHNLERHGKKTTRGYRKVAFLNEDGLTEADWH